MGTLVLFYSKTGSNRYLAERAAKALDARIEELHPSMNIYPFLLLGTAMGFGAGTKKLTVDPGDYHRVVVAAPLWMGKFALPVQSFVRKYAGKLNEISFITCCGSTEEKKNDRFGYEKAFSHMRKLAGDKAVHFEAFPIGLVIPPELQDDSDAFMRTRLSDGNFTGEILDRFTAFVDRIKN